jgi:cytochrome c oxidase subunit 4
MAEHAHSTGAAPGASHGGHGHGDGHGHGKGAEAHAAEHGHHDHTKIYLATFGALMVLTLITVAAAQVDLGFLNLAVALLIACTKASLVVLFFMHVFEADGLIRVTVAAGVIWLIIMFAFTFQDYLTRDWYQVPAF